MKTLCNAVNRHVVCYGDYVLCLLKPILNIVFILLPFITNAQDIKLANPSLEGTSAEAKTPASWFITDRTPDIQPGIYNISLPASEGTSYVGMYADYSLQEGMSQQLTQKLDSGKTYYISFDLAYPPTYYQTITYGSFIIYGGNTKGEKNEVLWESGIFYNQQWKKYTAVFTPAQNYSYLVFSPYKVEKDAKYNTVAVLVDNFSDIKEAIKLDLTSVNTCPGASNGGATAKILNADDNYTYFWEPSGDTVNTIKGLAAGKYKVFVRSRSGAKNYGFVEVSTSDVQAAVSVIPIDCAGDRNGIINIEATGGQTPYTFYLNDDSQGRTSGIMKDISGGKYTVKVRDNGGCTATLNNIIVDEPALLQLTGVMRKPVSCSGSQDGEITFNTAGGTPPYSYYIQGYGTQTDNVIRHLDGGQYHYRVMDSHGCSTDGDAEITKEWRDCAVFMPNAFSPNGDGLNDVFRAKVHDDVSAFRMAVYGRWGQLVYESSEPSYGWDGTQKGRGLPSGSYLWMITYTNSKQQAMKQQGTVLLVR
jgi:gliding motility-associated-like protein